MSGDRAAMLRPGKILFLGGQALDSLAVALTRMTEAVETGFRDKAEGLVEIPLKPTVHPRRDCFLRALPGYLRRQDVAGLKWVGAYPPNRRRGLPLVSGLVVLNDGRTGFPLAIMDGNWITARRTAAVSAVAAKHLAPSDAATLAVCGAGVQGDIHLQFLSLVLPRLKRVQVYEPDPDRLKAYLDRQTARHPRLEIGGTDTAREAVREAQVVVTAAPMREKPLAVVKAEDLAPGVLCLPLDLDSYFAPSAFAACDKVFCDDIDQLAALKGGGRFAHLKGADGDYGELVTGRIAGREDRHQRIMAVSVGIALGDLVVADLLYRQALRLGAGVRLEL